MNTNKLLSHVQECVSRLDGFRGFEVRSEDNPRCIQIVARSAVVGVNVYYDRRIDNPEIDVGLLRYQRDARSDIPIHIVAKFLELDRFDDSPSPSACKALEKICLELGWLDTHAQTLLDGDREKFRDLQQYYKGYCAAYTDYCAGEFDEG